MADELLISHNDNAVSGTTDGATYADYSRAQTITPDSDIVVNSVKIYARRRTGTPGNIRLSIQGVTGAEDKPDGVELGAKEEDSDAWSDVGAWHEFIFASGITLEASAKYAIVIEGSAAWPNMIYWDHNTTSPDYGDGDSYTYFGGAWGSPAGPDHLFECWGTLAPPGKAQNPTPSDDEEDIKIVGVSALKKLRWEAPD